MLAGFTGLKNLDLLNCGQLIGSMDVLAGLTSLTSLDVKRCKKLTGDVKVVANLTGLTSLSLTYAEQLSGHYFEALLPLVNLRGVFKTNYCGVLGNVYAFQLRKLVVAAADPSKTIIDEEASAFFAAYHAWHTSPENTFPRDGDATDVERGWFRSLFKMLVREEEGSSSGKLDKEWLLLLSVDNSLLAAAQVLLSEFGAEGTEPVEDDPQKRIVAEQQTQTPRLQVIKCFCLLLFPYNGLTCIFSLFPFLM